MKLFKHAVEMRGGVIFPKDKAVLFVFHKASL